MSFPQLGPCPVCEVEVVVTVRRFLRMLEGDTCTCWACDQQLELDDEGTLRRSSRNDGSGPDST